MPTTEAQDDTDSERDQYECAFHLLPTVADGEVARAFEEVKELLVAEGAEVFDEEMPQRFTLAYSMSKSIDGKVHHFANSWLGWVRFSFTRNMLANLTNELNHRKDVLRFIVIRLTREEIEHPQRVFEKKAEPATVVLSEADSEVPAEVSEEDLNKSLEGITS